MKLHILLLMFTLLHPFQEKGGIRLIRIEVGEESFDKKLEIDLCGTGEFLWAEYPKIIKQDGEWTDIYIYNPPHTEKYGSWKVLDKNGTDILSLVFQNGDTLKSEMTWAGNDILNVNGMTFRTIGKSEYCNAKGQ